MRVSRRWLVLMVSVVGLLIAAVPAAAGGGGGGGGGHCGGFGSGDKLVMRDNCFDKVAFSAEAGAELLVTNEGGQPHSYTAVDGSFDTGLMKPGTSVRITLGEAGIVQVYCTLHGTASGDGMSGIVLVGDSELAGAAAGASSSGLSAEAKGAIDQQTTLLAAEVAERAAGDAELRAELAAVRQQVDTLQSSRISIAGLLGALGTVLGGGALAVVYYRRRPAGAGQQ
jgi:plastocyanin